MKEGLGVGVGVLTLLSRSDARAKAAERAAARDASVSFRVAMPPPIRAVARGGSISKNPLFISNRPPSTPKTSIGSMMRLADPAIPSLLQEGLPTRREPTFDREALRASARLLCRPSFSFRFTSYSSRS